MLMIKLQPTGRKKRISYRIVVMEKRSKLTGKALDNLGYYNKNITPPELKVDIQTYEKWLEKGARPTRLVQNLVLKARKG